MIIVMNEDWIRFLQFCINEDVVQPGSLELKNVKIPYPIHINKGEKAKVVEYARSRYSNAKDIHQ